MDYYVVLFDDYTSMVPNTWVDTDTGIVAWPPGPVTHAGMKKLRPTTNWMEYKYKKIMGPFDFEKAKQLEAQTISCSTNDDTDDMVEKSQEIIGGKRTIKQKKISSDDESDEEESDHDVTPKKKSKRIPTKKNSNTNLSNLEMPIKPNHGSVKRSSQSNGKSNNIPTAITPTNNSLNNHSMPDEVDAVVKEVVETTNGTINNEAQGDSTTIPGTSNESGGLKEKSLDRGIKKTPTMVHNKKKNMMRTVRKKKLKELLVNELVDDDVDIEEDDEFEDIFPLTTVEDLNKFDATLKVDADTRKKLKTKLQKIDGHNITKHTTECLQRIMTDDLAVLYSYSGQSRGKNQQFKTLAFKHLKLFKVLRDAIVSTKFTYTESDFIKVLKRWLNCAKDRVNRRTAASEEEIEE